MGALSTMEITREDALKELRKAMSRLDEMSDEELENLLETWCGERTLHNFLIVRGIQWGWVAVQRRMSGLRETR